MSKGIQLARKLPKVRELSDGDLSHFASIISHDAPKYQLTYLGRVLREIEKRRTLKNKQHEKNNISKH